MHAVSPVIATLILIVIAIVGAVAVGLIMSRVSADTSAKANANQVAANAQTTLNVGGSSTIYPVIEAALPTFETQYGVSLNVVESSSGQGLEGVMIGALDVAAASSLPAVTSAEAFASTSYPGVNLVSTEIGGSGITIIANSGAGNFLNDGTDQCTGITQAALSAIYLPPGTTAADVGYFTINNGACADGVLGLAGVQTAGVTNFVPAATAAVLGVGGHSGGIAIVYRSDSSGTQDTFAGYLTGAGHSDTNFYVGTGESGNQGVLTFIQTAPGTNNPGGSIGFADLGFADGAAVGVTNGNADGVAITQVFTTAPATSAGIATGTVPTDAALSTAGFPLAVGTGNSASAVSTAILNGLKDINSNVYPDNGGTLVRTFYLVTNGTPSPIEQDFINYFTQSTAASQGYLTSNGYFSLYQINSGA